MDAISFFADYINRANKSEEEDKRFSRDQNMANALVEFMGMKPPPPQATQAGQLTMEESAKPKIDINSPETPQYAVNVPGVPTTEVNQAVADRMKEASGWENVLKTQNGKNIATSQGGIPEDIFKTLPINQADAVNQRRSTLLDQITGSQKGQDVIAHIAQQRLIPKEATPKIPHETAIKGADVPEDLRGKIVGGWSPNKYYRVLRGAEDPTGKVTGVVGEGMPNYAEIAGSTRGQAAFDKSSGQVRMVNWNEANAEPNRFVSTTDPNVKALQDQQKYATGIGRFVNRLDTLGSMITKNITEKGLNQGSKFANWTIQDLIDNKILGNGDIVGLKNAVKGFAVESSKVETGSIGISGATVEAMKSFDIPYTMPVKDLIKAIEWTQGAGRTVTDAMNMSQKQVVDSIYSGSQYKPPKNYSGGETPKSQPVSDIQSAAAAELARRRKGK